jgi:hypothetical protein
LFNNKERIMRRLIQGSMVAAALFVGYLAAGFVPDRLQAQQNTVTETTTSAAVTIGTDRVVLASATNVAAGKVLYIDREALSVTSVSSVTATVQRGMFGTAAATHASGAVVYAGSPNYFSGNDPAGPCVAANEVALKRIVLGSGNIYNCINSQWVRFRTGGLIAFTVAAPITYTTAGAITIKPGLSLIGSGGAIAMTLAAPTNSQDGMVMEITAITAQTHTITIAGGANGGSTATDVCTLSGSIGDSVQVKASGGVWYLIAARGCTLG